MCSVTQLEQGGFIGKFSAAGTERGVAPDVRPARGANTRSVDRDSDNPEIYKRVHIQTAPCHVDTRELNLVAGHRRTLRSARQIGCD